MFKEGDYVVVDNKTKGTVLVAEDNYYVVKLSNGAEIDFYGTKRLTDGNEFDYRNKAKNPFLSDTDKIWGDIYEILKKSTNLNLKVFMMDIEMKYRLFSGMAAEIHHLDVDAKEWNELNNKEKVSFIAFFGLQKTSAERLLSLQCENKLERLLITNNEIDDFSSPASSLDTPQPLRKF